MDGFQFLELITIKLLEAVKVFIGWLDRIEPVQSSIIGLVVGDEFGDRLGRQRCCCRYKERKKKIFWYFGMDRIRLKLVSGLTHETNYF